jgi:GR25 family glycosyltransferase involved in LPS biosynthesis
MSKFNLGSFPNAEFIKGTSYKNLPPTLETREILKRKIHFGMSPEMFDKPALAVALSHRKAWTRVIEINKPCLILEDDAIALPGVDYSSLEFLINRSNYPYKSILSLWKKGIHDSNSYNEHYIKLNPSFGNSGIEAYVIEPHMAKEFIDEIQNKENPIDHYVLRSGIRGTTHDYLVLCSKTTQVGYDDDKISLRASGLA